MGLNSSDSKTKNELFELFNYINFLLILFLLTCPTKQVCKMLLLQLCKLESFKLEYDIGLSKDIKPTIP